MNAQQSSTVVGVFHDARHADAAVNDLLAKGFRSDQIGVAIRHEGSSAVTNTTESEAAPGAVTGALTGLGLGALVGLGVLSGVIPIVGPAIAAGTLGVILSNAAAGAGIAGLVGALVGAGMSKEEASYYQTEFEAGRTIVSVQSEGRRTEAINVLREHGAYDMSTRGSVGSVSSTL